MTIEEALAYIHSRPKAGKKDSQARMAALLSALENPEKRMPPVIHVTGTNGKGSVSTMLSSIGQADGLRVGLFTSPYIVSFNDRFQINGQDIDDERLARYTKRVKEAVERVKEESKGTLAVTEFEVVTAIMFCYFSESQLDLAVVEVGIGGRFDSTNFMETTAVAVVTSVALDHEQLLGNTIEAIAKQKAGIFVSGQPVVLGPALPEEALTVMKDECRSLACPLLIASGQEPTFKSALQGSFQRENTQTAVLAYKTFRSSVSEQTIADGLQKAFLPGRFEEVLAGVYLDGAHNPAGLQSLQESIHERFSDGADLVIGALADKHLERALSQLAKDPLLSLWSFDYQGLPGRPGMAFDHFAPETKPIKSVEEALQMKKKTKRPLIFTGSLYFIADVRRQLCQMKKSSAQG
ncbi:bifunctional folylpolyglutamate synthase/dihydrofolate synthase [Fructobacillus papyrifericola]|uniref:Bifunctional folylpolyglutamate synthase/dihydrofolate synthase n=1 Tax=Fructobacillus papyrifericola TaxID=2713172 RepID=A0ABS5QT24_9LACO|nr:folylpolyglutamate synthase/dihydrofolate synthase family protein [Fructobacillus papyrifericola]MBS9336348.1 bifunctional folylpolyglutamate synthase/dihydrofolate synthase [Fructobacillus papyrifericola]